MLLRVTDEQIVTLAQTVAKRVLHDRLVDETDTFIDQLVQYIVNETRDLLCLWEGEPR